MGTRFKSSNVSFSTEVVTDSSRLPATASPEGYDRLAALMADLIWFMVSLYCAIFSDCSSILMYSDEPPMASTSATEVIFSNSGTIFWST